MDLNMWSYSEAVEFFLEVVTENSNLYYKTNNLSMLTPATYINEGGRKYDKITMATGHHSRNDSRVYCFIEKATGDIYKPAGLKAPYTKGNNSVRGNIFNMTCYEKADPHGSWLYYRRGW